MENIPSPTGPGREWTLPEIMELIDNRFSGRNFEHGRAMYAATGCVQCHRMDGSGGTMGPDLTALGRRFTLRDVTEAILKPNLAISDQYMMTVIETRQGQTLAGRIISRDNESIRIATDMLKPAFSTTVPIGEIAVESKLPVSTMPGGLLNSLNADEVLDLLAYLYSGANPDHPVFNP
jgi:putative heme-binding domain-containing protein